MNFIQDVIELPMITTTILKFLGVDDTIAFSIVSKDERFVEAIEPYLRLARFSKRMVSFFEHWNFIDQYYISMMKSTHDPDIEDNIIYSNKTSCATRMQELCTYLHTQWDIVDQLPDIKDAVVLKVTEMMHLLPDFYDEGYEFIKRII